MNIRILLLVMAYTITVSLGFRGYDALAQEIPYSILKSSVVKITSQNQVGVGFIVKITPNAAYIVTAARVIQGNDKSPTVELIGNQPITSVVQYTETKDNPHKGLALLAVNGKDVLSKVSYLPLSEKCFSNFNRYLKTKNEVIFSYGFYRGGVGWKYTELTYSGYKGRNMVLTGDINPGNFGSPIIKGNKVLGIITTKDVYIHAVSALGIQEFLMGIDGLSTQVPPSKPIIHQATRPKPTIAPKPTIHNTASPEPTLHKTAAPESTTRQSKPPSLPTKMPDKPLPTTSTPQLFNDGLLRRGLGPEMAIIPAGSFSMGDLQGDGQRDEQPVREVFMKRFAMSVYEITFAEYDLFADATGRKKPSDDGWGRGNRPVINVSWQDATAYTDWLSKETNQKYRLPTEAEWEYTARAGTQTKYWWGNDIGENRANCAICGSKWDNKQTAPVGGDEEFTANAFGLYDTVGNVYEWTCSADDRRYRGRERRCSCKESAQFSCVYRGGSWRSLPKYARLANRSRDDKHYRNNNLGFRVAREILE